MTIENYEIRRIAVAEEALADFGTDQSGAYTFADVPAQEGTMQLQLNKPPLDLMTLQQRLDGYAGTIPGPAAATLTFSQVLASHGTAAGDATDSPLYSDWALGLMLKIAFGGADDGNTGTTVATGTSATSFDVASATDLLGGGVLGWVNASGLLEARVISGVTGTTVDVKSALSATPSISDPVYTGVTFYPGSDPQTGFQMIVEGAEQSARWLLMGGQLNAAPTITRANGELPTIQWSITFANWAKMTEQAITVATYANFSPTYVAGDFAMKISGAATTTHTQYDVASVSYTLAGPVYQPVRSPNGVNTIARWRRTRTSPLVEVQVSLPYESAAFLTDRDDLDNFCITDQIGTAAGSTVLLEMPTAQLVDAQPSQNQDGLEYQMLTFRTKVDDGVSTGSGDQRYAAARIHLL